MDTSELYQHIVAGDRYEEKLVLENPHPEFTTYLAELMERRGVSRARMIRVLNVDRVYGYQLLNGIRRMKRDQMLLCGLYLDLDLTEMERLLRLGGRERLYVKDPRDARMVFALSRKMDFEKARSFVWGEEESDGRKNGV